MIYSARLLPVALLLLSFAWSVDAQTSEAKQTTPAKGTPSNSKPAKDIDAERALKERRSQARALLVALATDARNFRDQSLRARSLARIADALWVVDAEQGRTLFRKAWEAAEVADQESDQKLQEDIRQQKAKTGGGYAVHLPPNLRREVLRLAARHDRALGEEFLEKLKLATNASASAKLNSSNLPEALSQRLALAQELLDAGDTERAMQFAEPALGLVNMNTLNFLATLRDKNPSIADQRYLALLESTAIDLQVDANTISLLSSYLFTPHFFVTFSGSGTSTSQMSSVITAPSVAPELQQAFFRIATQVLSRPLPPPEQEQGTLGIEGKYLVIKRLLPLFEQYASPDITATVRALLDALNTVVSDTVRQRDDDSMRKGIRPEQMSVDREQALMDRIERAKNYAERDGIYLQLAFLAAGRGDIRARELWKSLKTVSCAKRLAPSSTPLWR